MYYLDYSLIRRPWKKTIRYDDGYYFFSMKLAGEYDLQLFHMEKRNNRE